MTPESKLEQMHTYKVTPPPLLRLGQRLKTHYLKLTFYPEQTSQAPHSLPSY